MSSHYQRPVGITLVSIFHILQGAAGLLLALGCLVVGFGGDTGPIPGGFFLIVGLVAGAFGLMTGSIGIGLWRMKPLALLCAILWTGFNCFSGISFALFGTEAMPGTLAFDGGSSWVFPLVFYGGMCAYMIFSKEVHRTFKH